MVRKYPELVAAKMTRLKDLNGEFFFVRQSTKIKFGNSQEIIGRVIMTNPGSFNFSNSKDWEDFKNGDSMNDIYEDEDYADLTMQNIIEVMRESYKSANMGDPNGIVEIHNISNVVQSIGQQASEYHQKVLRIIETNKNMYMNLLQDPVTNDEQVFLDTCKSTPVVIMGFVHNVFTDKVNNLVTWSQDVSHKIVVAKDNSNRYSHPRRWRAEPNLKEEAIKKLTQILILKS